MDEQPKASAPSQSEGRWFGLPLRYPIVLVFFTSLSLPVTAEPAASRAISLNECLEQVRDNNYEIRAGETSLAAVEKQAAAEWGVFEPHVIVSARRESNRRENTRQDFLSQASPLFEENNHLYRGAVEGTLPTGGQVRVGGEVSRLDNNLQVSSDHEFVTFLGLTVRQPLLKDFGYDTTMAQIRVAEKQTDVVRHRTRREMMGVLSRAEIAYWELFQAAREHELRSKSVEIAQDVLADNRDRVQAGKMSDLEIRQAKAELALRETQLEAAHQQRLDASARLKSFLAEEAEGALVLDPTDDITLQASTTTTAESLDRAYDNHPTLLALRNVVEQEQLRESYAQNQKLPRLDLSASYGLNGLGDTLARSDDQLWNDDYRSWYVGLELNLPVMMGVRERNEYQAAHLRKQEAQQRLKGAELELTNLLRAMVKRVSGLKTQVQEYRRVVDLQQSVLDAELEALDLGRANSRDVFDAENALTDARIAVARSLVAYQRRIIEREILEGSYLAAHNIERL